MLRSKLSSQIAVILFVSVIVTSAFTVVAAISTPVDAAKTTKLTLSPSTSTPTVGQSVTFTAALWSSTTSISSKSVTIYHYLNGVRYTDATKTTNAKGQITLTQSFGSAGIRTYYATFTGDTWYKGSTSSVVNINVSGGTQTTQLFFSPSTATPTVGQSVTFTAALSNTKTSLPSKPVTIYHYLNGVRYTDTTKTTNAYGQIALTQSFGSTGIRTYYATFAGDSAYKASTSSKVTVTVRTITVRIPTTLNIWAGYMGMPAFWLEDPQHYPVAQGSEQQVRYWVVGADGMAPCGVAKYYIDNNLAGGTWKVTPFSPYWQGCPAGLPGGAGGLYLHPTDTAKLSLGWHTLRIHYVGDSTYAPSDFVGLFLVVAS